MCVKRTSFSLESLIFYLEHQQTIFLGLFRPKTKKDQILIFQLTPWINPFGNSVKWTFFLVWKAFVSIQKVRKQYFLVYFDQKQRKIKFHFST